MRRYRPFAVKNPNALPASAPKIGPTNGSGIAISAPIPAAIAVLYATGLSNMVTFLLDERVL